MELKKTTSKAHFDKYAAMVVAMNLRVIDYNFFGTKKKLTQLFQDNEYLNNIELKRFDAMFPFNASRKIAGGPVSLSDNTSMYKHFLIYHVIGATPIFTK